MSEYLTTEEAAEIRRIKPQSLRVERFRGGGPPYYKLGETSRGRVLYRREEVLAWIEMHRVEPGRS